MKKIIFAICVIIGALLILNILAHYLTCFFFEKYQCHSEEQSDEESP